MNNLRPHTELERDFDLKHCRQLAVYIPTILRFHYIDRLIAPELWMSIKHTSESLISLLTPPGEESTMNHDPRQREFDFDTEYCEENAHNIPIILDYHRRDGRISDSDFEAIKELADKLKGMIGAIRKK